MNFAYDVVSVSLCCCLTVSSVFLLPSCLSDWHIIESKQLIWLNAALNFFFPTSVGSSTVFLQRMPIMEIVSLQCLTTTTTKC